MIAAVFALYSLFIFDGCQAFHSTSSRITRMGLPTARQFGGTFLLTSVFAPITALSPIVTPFKTVQLHPIHT